MAIKFNVGNGTSVYVESNTHPIDTQRGLLPANEIIVGDFIKNVSGSIRQEVITTPSYI